MNHLVNYLDALWSTTADLAPWLLLGAAIAGLLHAFLPAGLLNRHLAGRWGVVKAVALGVPMPLCSCGVIPVGLGLKKGGASGAAAVGFLISTPQTGVDSIFVSASMLGLPFALFKVAAAAVMGILGGWITDRVKRPDPSLILPLATPTDVGPTRSPMKEMVAHPVELLRSIWRWLAIGILISAAIATWVPPGALGNLSAYGGLTAMVVVLLISVPLYVCATASVPIAAALVASGLPTGAALVFLMAGPATNVATLGAVAKTLGRRALGVYLATIILGSVVAGLAFDAVIAPAAASTARPPEDPAPWWVAGSAAILIALATWFAFQEFSTWLRRQMAKGDGPLPLEVGVEGMTCGGCTAKLERALLADREIDSARVSLTPGRAAVRGTLSAERLDQIVREAGFSPR